MAVYVDATGERLARTANLPSPTAVTLSGWAKVRSDLGTNTFQPVGDVLSATSTGYYLLWENDAEFFRLQTANSGAPGAGQSTLTRPAVGTWFYWYIRCSGTGSGQLQAGWRPLGSDTWVTASTQSPSFTPTTVGVGDLGGFGVYTPNMAYAHVRCWNRVLTDTELLAESKSATPVSTTNLNFAWLLESVATLGDTDLGPNNREPTVTGTLGTEASPTLDGAAPLVAGTATAGLANGWLVTASATDATGGATPYSYQWQRSPRSAATWSDLTGKTTRNLTDRTVSPSTNYDYRLRYTDAASAVIYSNTLQVNVPAQADVWVVLGDSQTDEYRADDNRGAGTWEDYVLNWIEQLAEPNGASGAAVHHRGIDLGTWGTRAEPRRTGFANIWARSGTVMEDVLDDQLPGAMAQVSGGTATHVVLFQTANEWLNQNFPAYEYIDKIYNSPDGGTTALGGTPIATIISTVVGQITDVIDAAVAANAAGVVVLTVSDYFAGPGWHAAYPNAMRRGYLSAAVESIYDDVAAYAATVNSAAGVTVVSVERVDAMLGPIWATNDGTYITVAGVQLNWTVGSDNDGPLYFAIAPSPTDAGVSHYGTIISGVFANTFLTAANALPGIDYALLSDAEIRENAGLEALLGEATGLSVAVTVGEVAGAQIGEPAGNVVPLTIGSATGQGIGQPSGLSVAIEVGETGAGEIGAPRGLDVSVSIGAALAKGIGGPAGLAVAVRIGTAPASQIGDASGLSVAPVVGEATAKGIGAPAGLSVVPAVATATGRGIGAPSGLSVVPVVSGAQGAGIGAPGGLRVAASVGATAGAEIGVGLPRGVRIVPAVGAVSAKGIGAPQGVTVTVSTGTASALRIASVDGVLVTPQVGEASGAAIGVPAGLSVEVRIGAAGGVEKGIGSPSGFVVGPRVGAASPVAQGIGIVVTPAIGVASSGVMPARWTIAGAPRGTILVEVSDMPATVTISDYSHGEMFRLRIEAKTPDGEPKTTGSVTLRFSRSSGGAPIGTFSAVHEGDGTWLFDIDPENLAFMEEGRTISLNIWDDEPLIQAKGTFTVHSSIAA